MSWTKQTKTTPVATAGWGSMQWGVDAWGGNTATGWVNQSDASDSWTTVEDAD